MRTPDWHARMYDADFADRTINSEKFLALAETEVASLISTLGVRRDVEILDVPCGTGRHTRAFAKAGFDVTGVDINPMLLERARLNCADLSIKFIERSMADLSPFHGQIGVVVNLFSSFGYFPSDDENSAVLGQFVACLRPGGLLVLHSIDRDWLMRIYEPVSWRETDEEFSLEARKFDPQTNYNEVNEIRLDKATGKAQRTYHRMRLYNSTEIESLMREAGLRDVQVFGGFDGKPFTKGETSHPVFIARKAR